MAYLLFNKHWFAGFFDGEGSVSLMFMSTGQNHKHWRIVVSVSQKSKPVLDMIKRKFKGCISRASNAYQLAWSSKQAEKVIDYLLPLVHVKRRVLLLAKQHRKLIGVQDPLHFPKWVNKKHQLLAKKIRALNRGL